MSQSTVDSNGNVTSVFHYGNPKRVTVGAESAQSAVINAKIVRISPSVACHIEHGTNPTATTTSLYLGANANFIMAITPGDKIAVIQETTGGFLSIVEAL